MQRPLLSLVFFFAAALLRAATPDATVAADGSGTHRTVQSAIDAAPAGATRPFVILVKPGIYREHILVPVEKPFITLRGEPGEAAATVITLGTNVGTVGPDGKKLPTPESSTVLIRAADFAAENITFENTTPRSARIQALAFYITGDRAILRSCRFLGWQDTLRPDSPRPAGTEPDAPRPNGNARHYFADCTITGHVDFIYAAGTAVFDRCHIHVLGDGWITAASTPQNIPYGFVFLDCRVTAAPDVKQTYLGRPWRDHAATAFLRCELPAQLAPAGWHNWDRPAAEKTVRYAEYKNTGPGARPESRAPWSRQLTDDEANVYTVENILRGADGWTPAASRAR
jgi:pectinesterase